MRGVMIVLVGLLALATVAHAADKSKKTVDEETCHEEVWVYLPAPEGTTVYRAANKGKSVFIGVTSSVRGEDGRYVAYTSDTTIPVKTGVVVNDSGEDGVVFTLNGYASPVVQNQSDAAGEVMIHYLDLKNLTVESAPRDKDPGFLTVWVELNVSWKTGITDLVEAYPPLNRQYYNYDRWGKREVPSYPWRMSELLVVNFNTPQTTANVARCAKGIKFDAIDVHDIPPLAAKR